MNSKTVIKIFLTIVGLILLGWQVPSTAEAQPQDIVVPCQANGFGTSDNLRAAIQEANNRSGVNAIRLGANCIYVLDNLVIPNPVTGDTNLTPIREDVIIEGQGATFLRPDNAPPYRILQVEAGVSVTIRDAFFTNGRSLTKAGQSSSGFGGAILLRPQARLFLVEVSFDKNFAQKSGGAVYASSGVVTARLSRFENNEAEIAGGGLAVVGQLIALESRFVDNRAGGEAGALHLTGSGRIERNEFLKNEARGGPGGAIRIGSVDGNVNVLNNKFLHNTASTAGGAVFIRDPRANPGAVQGRFRLNNNLWQGNRAGQTGGHLDLHVLATEIDPFELHYNTFIGDPTQTTVAGITLHEADARQGPPPVPAKFFNNIIANHPVGIENVGPILPGGKRNLFFNNVVSLIGNFASNVAPILDDPRFVNPATGNFRLQSCSPAIDQGVDNGSVDTDLDGVARPQGQGFDLGAFEFGGTPGPCPDPTPLPGPGVTPEPDLGETFTVYLPLVVKE